MSIVFEGKANIFNHNAQTLVCTVNCMGAMGAGLAKAFKELVPGLYKAYKEQCQLGLLTVKNVFLYKPEYGPWVLCLPTKDDWKDPSKVEYIENNLDYLAKHYESMGITSIAIPPLGCGLGGLDYVIHVRPLLYRYLDAIDIPVYIVMESSLHQAMEMNRYKKKKSRDYLLFLFVIIP